MYKLGMVSAWAILFGLGVFLQVLAEDYTNVSAVVVLSGIYELM